MLKLFYFHIMFIAKFGQIMLWMIIIYTTSQKKEEKKIKSQYLEVQGYDNVKLEFSCFSNSPS